MEDKSIVAICIPAYEKKEPLVRLLNSIQVQTFKEYEVFITDDSKTMEIAAVVNDYHNIHYYHNERRRGATANCNEAIRYGLNSGADYIKIMHHDDCFCSTDALAIMVQHMNENKNANFLYCDSCGIINGKLNKCVWSEKQVRDLQDSYSILFRKNIIGGPSCTLIRNNSGFNMYFDEKLTWLIDIEQYMRILHYNPSFIHIDKVLIHAYADGNRVTDFCLQNPQIVLWEYWYIFFTRKYVRKGNIRRLLDITIENIMLILFHKR